MANGKPLKKIDDFSVCLNLSVRDRLSFPKHPAIYFVYVPPADVRYIGRTQCLKKRWDSIRGVHWLRFNSNTRVAWFPLPFQFHRTLEPALIDFYKPPHNFDPTLVR